MQIAQKLVHGFALGRAARNGRDLGPEAALLRIMHNNFDLHTGFLEEQNENTRSYPQCKPRRGVAPLSTKDSAHVLATNRRRHYLRSGNAVQRARGLRMCNAHNHSFDCDCGFGGDTGGADVVVLSRSQILCPPVGPRIVEVQSKATSIPTRIALCAARPFISTGHRIMAVCSLMTLDGPGQSTGARTTSMSPVGLRATPFRKTSRAPNRLGALRAGIRLCCRRFMPAEVARWSPVI